MAVRNFWVKANIDGRETELSGGPRAKDGGMKILVKQRNHGGKDDAVAIRCYESDGELFTEVKMNGEIIGVYATSR